MARGLYLFLILALGASIGASLAVALTGGAASALVTPLGLAVMLSPTVAAYLAARLRRDPVGDVGFRRFPLAFLPVALLALPLLQHAVNLSTLWLTHGRLPWLPWLTPDAAGVFHPPPEAHLGETVTAGGLAAGLLLKAVVGLLIVSLFALGEEIGWRGYMQRRLVERYGAARGIALGAAVWAAWHLPFALSGMHHVAGVPVFAMLLIMPAGHFGLGAFLGWLYQRTGSLWLAALAHGAVNNWGQFAFKLMSDAPGLNLPLLVANALALLAAGLAALLYLNAARPPRSDS